MKSIAIILARGGSKGIPNKNIYNFCNKPLIYWTIMQCIKSKYVKKVYVSSDSKKILDYSSKLGATSIPRPENIAKDESSSEEAWNHTLNYIKDHNEKLTKYILAPQVTSPLRSFTDFDNALIKVNEKNLDSLLSVSAFKDFFVWKKEEGKFQSENYDYKNRQRRQLIIEKFHENGSFYIFKPEILYKYKNRLGGEIGYFLMENYKSFQIDEMEDIKLCETIMKGYQLDEI